MINLIIKIDNVYQKTDIKLKTEVSLPITSIWINYNDLTNLYHRNVIFACGSSEKRSIYPDNVAFIRKNDYIEVIIGLYEVKEKKVDSLIKLNDPQKIKTTFYYSKIELNSIETIINL